jgi:hypothetical protein
LLANFKNKLKLPFAKQDLTKQPNALFYRRIHFQIQNDVKGKLKVKWTRICLYLKSYMCYR